MCLIRIVQCSSNEPQGTVWMTQKSHHKLRNMYRKCISIERTSTAAVAAVAMKQPNSDKELSIINEVK